MIFSFRHPKRRAKLDAIQDTLKKLKEAISISISAGSIAPSAPKEGSLWVDEPNNRMMVYTEGKWIQMSGDSELPRITNVLYFTDDPTDCRDMTPKTPCGSEVLSDIEKAKMKLSVGLLARTSANKFGIPVMGP